MNYHPLTNRKTYYVHGDDTSLLLYVFRGVSIVPPKSICTMFNTILFLMTCYIYALYIFFVCLYHKGRFVCDNNKVYYITAINSNDTVGGGDNPNLHWRQIHKKGRIIKNLISSVVCVGYFNHEYNLVAPDLFRC